MQDLHAEPLVDGQKFRFRAVELFLLCCRLDRPVEVRFRDEIRQAQDRDPAKIRFSPIVDRLRVRHLPEALERRHDIVEKAFDLVSRALAHLERVSHGVKYTDGALIRAIFLVWVTPPAHGDIVCARHGDDLRLCLRQVKFPVFFLEVKGHGPLLFQSSGMSSTFTPRLKAYSIVERVPPRAPSFTAISRLAWSTM